MPTGETAGPHRGAGRCSGKRFQLLRVVALGPAELKVTVDWKDSHMLSFGAGRAKGESRSGRKGEGGCAWAGRLGVKGHAS